MTSIIMQVICTFIICTICVNFPLMFAWPSTTLKLFGSSNTTLDRPMTETELALFGSLSSVTALISTPISGVLLDYLGRKYCIIIFSLPQIFAWTLVIISRRVETVLAARSIAGLGGCLFNLTPVYISEICHEKIRGTMTACSIIFYGIGILLSYILGGCLSFDMMNYACLTLSVAGILLVSVVRESPTYLMKKGLNKEAANAIAFYRQTKPDSKEVLEEMGMIRKTLNPDTDNVCTICVNFPLMFAWPSTTLKLFGSSNTTLDRPMTETELALFGSLSSVTALISTPISGVLLDYLGRKYCIIIFSLPQIFAWTLVIISRRVETVLAARSIAGLGGCLFNLTPVYISEICHEKIRGTMTACSIIFYGIGILLSYILGGCLSFDMMNYACLTLSVAGILLVSVVRESPTYLMKKGLNKEAANAIAFYRQTKPDSKEVLEEMGMIRKTLNPDTDNEEAPEHENLNGTRECPERPGLVQFIKKSKSTRKGLFIILVLYALSLLQGLIAVQVYAEPVFQAVMPSVSPTVLSVAFAALNIVVGFVAAYLTDLTGRRPLMIYSSLAAGVCCVLLGSQFQLQWGPHWLSGVFIYAFCVFYTAGAGTIPYVVVADLFLPEVRSMMTMVAVEWSWVCSFVLLIVFNPLVEAMGLGGVFYVYAAICFAATAFSFIYMPETKGLTVDVIQTVLMSRKKH